MPYFPESASTMNDCHDLVRWLVRYWSQFLFCKPFPWNCTGRRVDPAGYLVAPDDDFGVQIGKSREFQSIEKIVLDQFDLVLDLSFRLGASGFAEPWNEIIMHEEITEHQIPIDILVSEGPFIDDDFHIVE